MERRKLALKMSTANPGYAQNPNNKNRSTSRSASTRRHPVNKTKHPTNQPIKAPNPKENTNGNVNVQNRNETWPLEL